MGLLYSFNDLKRNRLINEAEVNGEDQSDPNNQPEDYTDDNQPDNQAPDNNNPPPPDGGNQDAPPPDDNGEGQPPEDYTEYGDDMGEDDQGAPPPQGQQAPEEEQPVDDIKQQEEELYGDLTIEQLNARHRELKSRFLDLYDVTKSILNRIDNINISEENIAPVKYISKTLNDLNDILIEYVNNAYSTKSYTENAVNFNRFLAILKGVEKVFNEFNTQDNDGKSSKE